MTFKEWLKTVFPRVQVPEEARDALRDVTSEREAVKVLDGLRGTFLIDLREIDEEIIAVSNGLGAQEDLIGAGGHAAAAERTTLERIGRDRKRLWSLERRQSILNAKVNIVQDMADAIHEAEAMRLQGVTEERIDEVIAIREDRAREWTRVLTAGREVGRTADVDPEGEKRRQALKQEILGRKRAEAPAAVAPVQNRKTDVE